MYGVVRPWPEGYETICRYKQLQVHTREVLYEGVTGVALFLTYLGAACGEGRYTEEEVERALRIALAQGFGLNHSLCHGDLGNVELLLQASRSLGGPEWRHQLERMTSVVLESVERDGWLCGIPLGVESPGLMPGLAGIGYQLLRLAEPEFVPSVLTLGPPHS